MNVSRRTITILVAATAVVAVFAAGFALGRTTGDELSAETRACRVFDLASSRLEAAAVTPTSRGYFTPTVVESWRQQTARIDAVVSTDGLEEPVFSALRDVGNAYAATTATADSYMDADSWNAGRIKRVLADNAEAEFKAAKICGEVTA